MPGHVGFARRITLAQIMAGGSVTFTGITVPQWSSTPSPMIIEGVAGSYALPVSSASSMAWKAPGSKPAWLTLTGTTMSWSSAATAQTLSGVVLTATNGSGSTDSSAFTLTVQSAPSSTGFFSNYVSTKRTINQVARNDAQGISWPSKHNAWVSHPAGRDYVFGGDWETTSGTTAPIAAMDSGQQTMYSVNPTLWAEGNNPSAWRLEHPYWPDSGYEFPVHHDKSSVAWDSKRRVFWQIGGFNFTDEANYPAPTYGGPAGVIGFKHKVGKFDPSKPVGRRWTNTGVAYQPTSASASGASEHNGPAVYDPVLDVVFGGRADDASPLQIFDPAALAWRGNVRFTSIAKLSNGHELAVLAIDPVGRVLYVSGSKVTQVDSMSPVTAVSMCIAKIAIPATLPAAGATADWSAFVTVVWSNPNALIPVNMPAVIDGGGARKFYSWLRGPVGASIGGLDPGNAIYGTNGRASSGNASFGSANTGVLVDLDTGHEEATQLPLPTFADGQGWVIPNITHWNAKTRTLWYGTCKFEATEVSAGTYQLIEPKLTLIKKPLPSWVPSAQYAWTKVPNSDFSLASDPSTGTPGGKAVRAAWADAEASGGRACRLNFNANPWNYSQAALRQRDAALLFHGGGGGDGEGNGVIVFTANSDTPDWSLLMPPTARSLVSDGTKSARFGGAYADSYFNQLWNVTFADPTVISQPPTPVAQHSYGACTFLESRDTWVRFGTQKTHPHDQGPGSPDNLRSFGVAWSEGAKPMAARAWITDFTIQIPNIGSIPENPIAVLHPWTDDVLYHCGGHMHYWKAATNTWISRVDEWQVDYDYQPRVIDPVNNVALCPAKPWAGQHPRLIDLKDFGSTQFITGNNATSWTGPAAAEFRGGQSHLGYAWDDDNACIWCVKAAMGVDASFDLYRITLVDKAACVWNVEKVTTSEASTGARPSFPLYTEGMGKTVRWSRELGGLLVNTAYNAPIHFIKTSTKV